MLKSTKSILAETYQGDQTTIRIQMSHSEESRRPELHEPVMIRPWETNCESTDLELEENQERRRRVGYAPNPLCKACHGSGFVHPLDKKGRVDYSKNVSCKASDCLADSIQHYKESGQYLEIKGISSRLQTFDQFLRRAGTEKSLTAFKQLAHGKTDKPFLLCVGTPGCGKTHLSQALTTELNRRGIDAYYYRVPDLLKILRASMETHNTDEWLKSLAEVGGLVLDDYGLENQTDWATASIEDIVDARWQEKRITVMTTNRDITELSPRLKSRFGDTELSVGVVNSGKDYRTGGK